MSKAKRFDAVRMMREIRDELSRKLVTMDHEEQRAYLEEQLRAALSSEQKPERLTRTARTSEAGPASHPSLGRDRRLIAAFYGCSTLAAGSLRAAASLTRLRLTALTRKWATTGARRLPRQSMRAPKRAPARRAKRVHRR